MIIDEQQKRVQLGGESIPFLIKKGKQGRVSLSLKEGGLLQITTGKSSLGTFEQEFLRKQASWILKHYRSLKGTTDRREEFLSRIDREIILLGQTTPVQYHVSPKTSFHFKSSEGLILHAPEKIIQNHKKELLYFGLREMAKQKLPKTLEQWAETCEIKQITYRIKDHKSRWGSCSSQRNINLNWQLLFLEQTLIDYVIIHELMHLHEMNHSKRFWNWVGKYYPNYQQARNQIKEYQWLIGILK